MPGNSLRGLTAHVIGGNRLIEHLLKTESCRLRGIETADIIVFTGGTDINPQIYKQNAHSRTQFPDLIRDRMEQAVYQNLSKNQWKVGICRGAQLLHALNGGVLWQHVEGHGHPHEMRYVRKDGTEKVFMVSSTHHQMMNLRASNGVIWGWSNQTRRREFPDGKAFEMSSEHWKDPEIIYYKDSLSLCFQPHPEYSVPKDTKTVFLDCLNRAVEL